MNTDIRQQIQAALRAFSGADLRAASIGLLNTLAEGTRGRGRGDGDVHENMKTTARIANKNDSSPGFFLFEQHD